MLEILIGSGSICGERTRLIFQAKVTSSELGKRADEGARTKNLNSGLLSPHMLSNQWSVSCIFCLQVQLKLTHVFTTFSGIKSVDISRFCQSQWWTDTGREYATAAPHTGDKTITNSAKGKILLFLFEKHNCIYPLNLILAELQIKMSKKT